MVYDHVHSQQIPTNAAERFYSAKQHQVMWYSPAPSHRSSQEAHRFPLQRVESNRFLPRIYQSTQMGPVHEFVEVLPERKYLPRIVYRTVAGSCLWLLFFQHAQ